MSIYIYVMLIMVILQMLNIVVSSNGYNVNKLLLMLNCIILFFLYAFRDYSIGKDTETYILAFDQLRDMKLKDSLNNTIYGTNGAYTVNLEPGYRFFNKIVSVICRNEQAILFFVGVWIFVLLYIFIKNNSTLPLVSIWLFLTLGIFQEYMNISRNAMGILLCYWGLKYITEKRKFKFITVVLIASLFHISSLFFLPLYWIVNYIPLSLKKFKLYTVIVLVFGLSFSFFGKIVNNFIPIWYEQYANTNVENISGVLVGLFLACLFMFIMHFVSNSKKDLLIIHEKLGIWMFLISLLFYLIGINLQVSTRMASIFSAYLIILFPRIVYFGIDVPKKRNIVLLLLFIICGSQYIFRMTFNNIGSTIPFEFFWN